MLGGRVSSDRDRDHTWLPEVSLRVRFNLEK